MERLLKVKEVAELLSVDESTVYKWADQGRLCYVDLGKDNGKRCLRFREKDLEKLIEKNLKSSHTMDKVVASLRKGE